VSGCCVYLRLEPPRLCHFGTTGASGKMAKHVRRNCASWVAALRAWALKMCPEDVWRSSLAAVPFDIPVFVTVLQDH
jgi:hypothetical protein